MVISKQQPHDTDPKFPAWRQMMTVRTQGSQTALRGRAHLPAVMCSQTPLNDMLSAPNRPRQTEQETPRRQMQRRRQGQWSGL